MVLVLEKVKNIESKEYYGWAYLENLDKWKFDFANNVNCVTIVEDKLGYKRMKIDN